ncbi:hypothetical protein Ahy_A06g028068 [Arachis hypogaea]|uniref:RNase H type-1 domain-containing protein n=1 Tax=Arachis hypogaea TaxID=3818 RepID=A0A445CQF3_ARAHY|nr:hypothetical protein Ahy_A06g028068 [Arachis hypogaea]
MRLNAGTNYDLCSSKVGFLVWEVWKARNLAIYQKISPNPIMVIHKAKLMELEFAEMIEEPAKHATTSTRLGSRVTWRPPLQSWIKCNVDAAFMGAQSVGTMAIVFRDHNGTLLSGINSNIVAASPLDAEALATGAFWKDKRSNEAALADNLLLQMLIQTAAAEIRTEAEEGTTVAALPEELARMGYFTLIYGFQVWSCGSSSSNDGYEQDL